MKDVTKVDRCIWGGGDADGNWVWSSRRIDKGRNWKNELNLNQMYTIFQRNTTTATHSSSNSSVWMRDNVNALYIRWGDDRVLFMPPCLYYILLILLLNPRIIQDAKKGLWNLALKMKRKKKRRRRRRSDFFPTFSFSPSSSYYYDSFIKPVLYAGPRSIFQTQWMSNQVLSVRA